MTRRLAGAMSLLVFAVCLVVGMSADNPLATTLSRALVAMGGTFVIALVLGAMGQRMLDENLAAQRKQAEERRLKQAAGGTNDAPPGKPEIPAAKRTATDR